MGERIGRCGRCIVFGSPFGRSDTLVIPLDGNGAGVLYGTEEEVRPVLAFETRLPSDRARVLGWCRTF